MQHEMLTVWIERTWVSDTAGWLAAKQSAGANTKRTDGGQDPCWSDEEALWTQASEDREVGMVVGIAVTKA